MSEDKKYRVKLNNRVPQERSALVVAIDSMKDIRDDMESAGLDAESIINVFSQAYAIVGMRYDVPPEALVEMLTINGLSLGIMASDPTISPDDLVDAVESEINGGEVMFDRSTPDPDMPLFLAPGVGEA